MIASEIKVSRFWSKVALGIESDCWLWSAGKYKGGYGKFSVSGRGRYAHRIAWMLERGCIPAGMAVLHRCDNPPCVNPLHLFLGTQQQNIADMRAKGRAATPVPPDQRGKLGSAAKLTELDVECIRRLYATGVFSQLELANAFGVCQMSVSNVVRRKTWMTPPLFVEERPEPEQTDWTKG